MVQVSPKDVEALVGMGFTPDSARNALARARTVEAAVDLLFSCGGVVEPIPAPPPSPAQPPPSPAQPASAAPAAPLTGFVVDSYSPGSPGSTTASVGSPAPSTGQAAGASIAAATMPATAASATSATSPPAAGSPAADSAGLQRVWSGPSAAAPPSRSSPLATAPAAGAVAQRVPATAGTIVALPGAPLTKQQEEQQMAAAMAASRQSEDDQLAAAIAASSDIAPLNEDIQLQQALQASTADAQSQGLVSLSQAAAAAAKSREEEAAMQAAIANSAAESHARVSANPHDRKRGDQDLPLGLRNLGNTCYVNSLIQAYARIPRLVRAVFAYQAPTGERLDAAARERVAAASPTASPPDDVAAVALARSKLANAVALVLELQRLFASLLLSTQRYADAAPVLEKLLDDNGERFRIGQQEDVSEFNGILLNRLEEALEAAGASAPPSPALGVSAATGDRAACDLASAAATALSSSTTGAPTIVASPSVPPIPSNKITRFFYGAEHKRLQPVEHGVFPPITHADTFSGLLLRLDDSADLYDSIARYVEPTTVPDYEGPSGVRTDAIEQSWFTRLPPVLTIVLQRAQYDRAQQRLFKSHAALKFPTRLVMDRFMYDNADWAAGLSRRAVLLRAQIALLQRQCDDLQTLPQAPDAPTGHGTAAVLTSSALVAVAAWLQRHAPAADQDRHAADDKAVATAGGAQDPAPESCVREDASVNDAVELLHERAAYVRKRVIALKQQQEHLQQQLDQLYDDRSTHQYRLHAVLVHRGAGVASGHYWACIYDVERGVWFKYNDASVSKVSEEDVMAESIGGKDASSSAYCLIYVRVSPDGNGSDADAVPMQQLAKLVPATVAAHVANANADFAAELARWDAQQQQLSVDSKAREITALVGTARDYMLSEIAEAGATLHADSCLLGPHHMTWNLRSKRQTLLSMIVSEYERRVEQPFQPDSPVGRAITRAVLGQMTASADVSQQLETNKKELSILLKALPSAYRTYLTCATMAHQAYQCLRDRRYVPCLRHAVALLHFDSSRRYSAQYSLVYHVMIAAVLGATRAALHTPPATEPLLRPAVATGAALASVCAAFTQHVDAYVDEVRHSWIEFGASVQDVATDQTAELLTRMITTWSDPISVIGKHPDLSQLPDLGPLPPVPEPDVTRGRDLMLDLAHVLAQVLQEYPLPVDTIPGPPRGFA